MKQGVPGSRRGLDGEVDLHDLFIASAVAIGEDAEDDAINRLEVALVL